MFLRNLVMAVNHADKWCETLDDFESEVYKTLDYCKEFDAGWSNMIGLSCIGAFL